MTASTRARLFSLALIASLHALPASAQDAPATASAAAPTQPSEAAPPPVAPVHSGAEVGTASRRWLQAQGAREQASAKQPTLSGPVMRRVHERYVKSFEQAVPEQLTDDRPASRNK